MNRQLLRRRLATLAVLLCALVIIQIPAAQSALADPDEGSVSKKLDKAIDEYVEAKETLDRTETKQKEIEDEIDEGKKQVKVLRGEVNDFADAAYMHGGLPESVSILADGSPERAVDSMAMLNYLGGQTGKKLNELLDARDSLSAKKDSLEEEQDEAKKAKGKLKDARDKAALDLAGAGGGEASGPPASEAPEAEAAPRSPDGSLPDEGCSESDPTTDGCISPRMEHLLEQAVIAGYQKETSCFRTLQDGGDHPDGKACDFTVGANGGAASGDAKAYGDEVANWMVQNADPLGIRIVIWYNEIWNPARGGWHQYDGGNTGDPNSDHTNHVHVSVQ